MRRLFLVFLLSLLPLQWVSAAGLRYCQHETARQSQQHIGHHAHSADAHKKSASKEQKTTQTVTPECDLSHHGSCHAAWFDELSLPLPKLSSVQRDVNRVLATSRPADTPERPNWHLLA